MTNQEVEEVKGHFDRVSQEIRAELRQEIADLRRYTGVVAEDLRSEIRAVAAAVAGANGRAEIHRLHETDDGLCRRIEAREQRGA